MKDSMRLLWIDLLKIVAIFGVILLHTSAPFLVPFEDSGQWWTGNVYDSLSRWCVPLFIMASGALVLPGADKVLLRDFLLVRMRHILIPFLAWSFIYFIYSIHVKGQDHAFLDFFPMVIAGPIYYHLWFIYMLITLYLFAPVISALLNLAPRKFAWYLVGIWLCWASLLPVVHELLNLETYFVSDLNEYSALKLCGYFILGYMLKENVINSKGGLVVLLLLFLIGGAATIMGTYILSSGAGEFVHFFYDYFSITVITMTLALFLFLKSVFNTPKEEAEEDDNTMNSRKLLRKISMSVFGVYLVHALILEVLRDGRLGFTINHSSAFGIELPVVAGIPLFAASIFVVSLGLILICSHIPVIRKIIT